jgi:hypothetical protein
MSLGQLALGRWVGFLFQLAREVFWQVGVFEACGGKPKWVGDHARGKTGAGGCCVDGGGGGRGAWGVPTP